ncbi:MAG: alpha/beta fold hydrolase [Promethearchaeota archaeon]|nr:MAG: alpha/beta fold hydrolase [Candidatus Lokiarchaeota archaeon]
MVEIEILFISNKEIKLEAEFFKSSVGQDNPVVLICHPHPQYGGNMYNNVVSNVFNKLIKNKISCLRFNFRGVGKSTGTHSGGEGEISDVQSCIDFLINEKKFEKIIICGYSYGAAIGCSAINYSDEIIGYVSISFPWDFIGTKFRELSQSNKPKLFIQGNQDTIAVYSNFEQYYNQYHDPKRKKIIDGADHFYWGYERQVVDEILEFYNSML